MNTPANTKILLRESAGAYLILTAGGEIRRWWPSESLLQSAELTPEAVAAIRAGQGWTQAEMGEKMAVGKTAVGNWESGLRRPAVANLRLLYIALATGKKSRQPGLTTDQSGGMDAGRWRLI